MLQVRVVRIVKDFSDMRKIYSMSYNLGLLDILGKARRCPFRHADQPLSVGQTLAAGLSGVDSEICSRVKYICPFAIPPRLLYTSEMHFRRRGAAVSMPLLSSSFFVRFYPYFHHVKPALGIAVLYANRRYSFLASPKKIGHGAVGRNQHVAARNAVCAGAAESFARRTRVANHAHAPASQLRTGSMETCQPGAGGILSPGGDPIGASTDGFAFHHHRGNR